MTLVFAKDSSPDAIREALEAGRTVAWAGKYLIGTEKNVRDLFNASVSIAPSHHSKVNRNNNTHKVYEVTNNSDLVFEFKLTDGKGTKEFILTPSSSALITAPEKETKLTYELSNTLIRSDKHLTIEFDLK